MNFSTEVCNPSVMRVLMNTEARKNLAGMLETISQRGLTIQEAAKSIGIAPVKLRKYASGTTTPTERTYNMLARFFGWELLKGGEA